MNGCSILTVLTLQRLHSKQGALLNKVWTLLLDPKVDSAQEVHHHLAILILLIVRVELEPAQGQSIKLIDLWVLLKLITHSLDLSGLKLNNLQKSA